MDPDKRAKLVAMEVEETPPPQAPPAPPAKPLPPRALAFLDGPTDEHRVAGLLLLAAADALDPAHARPPTSDPFGDHVLAPARRLALQPPADVRTRRLALQLLA